MLACIANETPCSCSAAPPEAAVTSRRRAVRFLPAVWAACLNNAETHSLSTASHKPQRTPNCQRRRIWLGNCFFLIMYVCEKSLRREGYYCSSVIDLVCDGRNAIGPVPFSSMLSLASENPRKLSTILLRFMLVCVWCFALRYKAESCGCTQSISEVTSQMLECCLSLWSCMMSSFNFCNWWIIGVFLKCSDFLDE